MTHLFDLANIFGEPGMERVRTLLKDPESVVGVSVLTLYETYATVLHRTGSYQAATETMKNLREAVSEVVPVTKPVIDLALDLRRAAGARIALADCLIAATALRSVGSRPALRHSARGRPAQGKLPDRH